MDQNMEKIDLYTFFEVTLHHGLYWNKTVIFEFIGTFLTILYFVQSCFILLFFGESNLVLNIR